MSDHSAADFGTQGEPGRPGAFGEADVSFGAPAPEAVTENSTRSTYRSDDFTHGPDGWFDPAKALAAPPTADPGRPPTHRGAVAPAPGYRVPPVTPASGVPVHPPGAPPSTDLPLPEASRPLLGRVSDLGADPREWPHVVRLVAIGVLLIAAFLIKTLLG